MARRAGDWLGFWGLLLALAGANWILSSDLFSAERTETALRHCWALFGSLKGPWELDWVNLYIRKSLHVLGYGVLALVLQRPWRSRPPLARVSRALILLALWSALDEYRQTFTRTRQGSLSDVLLDWCAGAAALGAACLVDWLRARRTPDSQALAGTA